MHYLCTMCYPLSVMYVLWYYVCTVVLCMYYGIMYVLLYYVCTVVLCIYYVLCMNYRVSHIKLDRVNGSKIQVGGQIRKYKYDESF